MRGEDGFTMIEVLVAALILAVGVAVTLVTLSSSGKFSLVSERSSTLTHTAQNELERILALPYSQVSLTGSSGSWSSTPGDYTYVSPSPGACPANSGGPAPNYQPDHSGSSSSTEPLVINGCTYSTTVNGTSSSTTPNSGTIAPVTAWSAPLQSGSTVGGNIYDFVTWTADPTCGQTPTPGSSCDTSKDYKRVTVVVTMTGVTQPSHPAIVSGYVTPPSTGKNPLNGSGTSCTSGTQTVSCTNNPPPNYTGHQYFFCGTTYSNGSCTEPPPCSNSTLHDTLEPVGSTPPAPDLLSTSPPTGTCTTPPCLATDVGCGTPGTGLPLPSCTTGCPSTGSAPCYSPPPNNTNSHSWVTPAIPAGVTWNLTGTGNLTTYLESSTSSTIQATLCVGLYVVPAGALGTLSGNLLAAPIGAAASTTVQATAGVATPVTFDFNTGSGTYAVASTGATRIEVVLWVAGASSPANLVYDQAGFAGQMTFFTT
jgi:prepilin-type N-terminal cleavage/methylation domain-containing protein